MLLQLQQPLVGLSFTYQEIRTSLTDMRQLLLLLKRTAKVASPRNAPPLVVDEGVVRFENVSFGYSQRKVNGAAHAPCLILPEMKPLLACAPFC